MPKIVMKGEYRNVQDFLDDLHECLDMRELVKDLGIFTKDEMDRPLVKCCFHKERTGSLQIVKNCFRCYGCGERGDAVKFVQNYYSIGFIQAIKKIAGLYNINISDMSSRLDGIGDSVKREWTHYLSCMEGAPDVVQEMRRDFFPQEIGYDPKLKYVVLPLTSKSGQVLGFTKRRVDALFNKDESGRYPVAKWRHSNLEDSLISQCHNLYNLENAGKAIRQDHFVIVCEGPKDAIAWRRAGIDAVVGVCGTSNSNNIWGELIPVERIYLSMDGDKAGILSTVDSGIYLAGVVDIKTVYALPMPDGLDPYDVVTSNGGAARLKSMLEHPVRLTDFVVQHGTLSNCVDLLRRVPEYNRVTVMKSICKVKGFSLSEAESWLHSVDSVGPQSGNPINSKDERAMLVAIVRGEVSDPSIKPDRAMRILTLKYGMQKIPDEDGGR